jgi:hypothetical protein
LIVERLPAHESVEERQQLFVAANVAPQLLLGASVLPGGFELAAVAQDAWIVQQLFYFRLLESGQPGGVETSQQFPKSFPAP